MTARKSCLIYHEKIAVFKRLVYVFVGGGYCPFARYSIFTIWVRDIEEITFG
ncbi:hypothetical protein MNBD_ALPHA02-1517 [hydrothermal vent metagenome]|uniref:Uncharacterized protein n=1 Tax=hydrothermal vent metagenome TaxID=652676 RepID=A0A3B0RNA9_9ZZZZ